MSSSEKTLRLTLPLFLLLYNTLVWFYMQQFLIQAILLDINAETDEILAIWAVFYASFAFFALVGGIFSKKVSRGSVLGPWMIAGGLLNTLAITGEFRAAEFMILAATWGSIGLGFPALFAFFADNTASETRGREAGKILLAMLLSLPVVLILTQGIPVSHQAITAGAWRMWAAFVIFAWFKHQFIPARVSVSFQRVLGDKRFALYFIPWLLFSLVNQSEMQVISYFLEARFFGIVTVFALTSAAGFAFVGGHLVDKSGRRRVVIFALAVLGLGYAGASFISPEPVYLTFFMIFDGAAWGIFLAAFIVLWGDFSSKGAGERYYSLGILPPFIAAPISLLFTPFLSTIPLGSTFSLAALFLFVAIIPLLYAPETLSEEARAMRETKEYLKSASKLREKHGI